MGAVIVAVIVVVIVVFVVWKSFHSVGATEVGLVGKRFAFRKLDEDNPIAFRGEAGYQATMLMPGLRFKLWPLFGVKKFPWVQVPAGEIGVVIAQVGAPLPIGAKSAPTSNAIAPDHRPMLTRRASDHCFPFQSLKKSSVTMVEVEFTRPETVDMMPLMTAATTSPRNPIGTTAATTAG